MNGAVADLLLQNKNELLQEFTKENIILVLNGEKLGKKSVGEKKSKSKPSSKKKKSSSLKKSVEKKKSSDLKKKKPDAKKTSLKASPEKTSLDSHNSIFEKSDTPGKCIQMVKGKNPRVCGKNANYTIDGKFYCGNPRKNEPTATAHLGSMMKKCVNAKITDGLKSKKLSSSKIKAKKNLTLADRNKLANERSKSMINKVSKKKKIPVQKVGKVWIHLDTRIAIDKETSEAYGVLGDDNKTIKELEKHHVRFCETHNITIHRDDESSEESSEVSSSSEDESEDSSEEKVAKSKKGGDKKKGKKVVEKSEDDSSDESSEVSSSSDDSSEDSKKVVKKGGNKKAAKKVEKSSSEDESSSESSDESSLEISDSE